MRYKEFKEKVKAWGQKYYYKPIVEIDDRVVVKIYYVGDYRVVAMIDNKTRLAINTGWLCYRNLQEDAKKDLFKIITEFAATNPADRKDEKRFIIPLPGLVTTDGEQQYLTQNGSFFASRREKRLKQTWKEEHLKFVPEIYRQFAEEFDEDKEY